MYAALGRECLLALELSVALGWEKAAWVALFHGEWRGGGGYSQTNQEDPL